MRISILVFAIIASSALSTNAFNECVEECAQKIKKEHRDVRIEAARYFCRKQCFKPPTHEMNPITNEVDLGVSESVKKCVEDCTKRLLKHHWDMNIQIASWYCRKQCPDYSGLTFTPDNKEAVCVSGIKENIKQLMQLPKLKKIRSFSDAKAYFNFFIKTFPAQAKKCKGVKAKEALVYVRNFVPEKFSECYSDAIEIAFDVKDAVSFWKKSRLAKAQVRFFSIIPSIQELIEDCKHAI